MKLADLRRLYLAIGDRVAPAQAQASSKEPAPELTLSCDAPDICVRCARSTDDEGRKLELEMLPSGRRICVRCRILETIAVMRSFTTGAKPPKEP
jgi:plasmid stabilization system protein ParE